jgi:hypothetical protein
MTMTFATPRKRARARRASRSERLSARAEPVKSFTSRVRKKKFNAETSCPAAREIAAFGCAGSQRAARAAAIHHETRRERVSRFGEVSSIRSRT